MTFPLKKVDIPEGSIGRWKVDKFTLTSEQAATDKLFADIQCMQGCRAVSVPQGTYTRLNCGSNIIMSDTPSEMYDHTCFVSKTSGPEGRVLIAGLGIGMVIQAVLDREEVDHVTVVERSAEVIKLVAPTYQARYGDRLEVIHSDIFDWRPPKGVRWNAAWFDIWATKCPDNLQEITRLKRRFSRRCDQMGFWVEGFLRGLKRRF